MPVMNASGMQCTRQLVAVELGIVPGTRDGADIHQAFDAVRFEKTDELRGRAGGVPDGHDYQRFCGGVWLHGEEANGAA
jgi:hypothetical protein